MGWLFEKREGRAHGGTPNRLNRRPDDTRSSKVRSGHFAASCPTNCVRSCSKWCSLDRAYSIALAGPGGLSGG
jgi:hypothetical protein